MIIIALSIYSSNRYDIMIDEYTINISNNNFFRIIYDNNKSIDILLKNYIIESEDENKIEIEKEIKSRFSDNILCVDKIIINLKTDKSKNEMTKMKNVILSYQTKVNETINLYKDKNYSVAFESYQKSSRINELMDIQYIKYNSIIDQDIEQKIVLLETNREKQQKINICIIIVTILIGIFISYVYTKKILTPIKDLAEQSKTISTGKFNVKLRNYRFNDEINILNHAFIKMANDIQYYIDEINEKAEIEKALLIEQMSNLEMKNSLKEMELKTAYSQINPHFLFNTLNIISQTAMIEKADDTQELIEATTELLRYNLDQISEVVLLEKEFNCVVQYIFIQEKRFGTRIRFTLDIDPFTKDIMIPSLIIQPLVENAILHGLKGITEKGKIEISTKLEKDEVIITVKDNGIGFSKAVLDRMNNNSGEVKQKTRGIGLSGVKKRLELFYNRTDIIQISNENGGKVYIAIPYY